MREILFRGKAINRDKGYHKTKYKNGDWVYGLVTRLYDNRFENLPAEMTDINGVSGIEVDYKTVGQYTGLTDKNGKKIFEGDIVKREYTLWHGETKKTRETQIGVVSYSNKDCGFCLDKVCNLRKPWDGDTHEIIGNIHDNKLEDF